MSSNFNTNAKTKNPALIINPIKQDNAKIDLHEAIIDLYLNVKIRDQEKVTIFLIKRRLILLLMMTY